MTEYIGGKHRYILLWGRGRTAAGNNVGNRLGRGRSGKDAGNGNSGQDHGLDDLHLYRREVIISLKKWI
jgi:hypothetical protein